VSDPAFDLKRMALPVFGPSVLYGVANGAIMPVVALSARELDASLAVAGLIAALIGVGSLFSNIPAALITARYGERRSMVGAAAFCVLALLLCLSATRVWMLALGVLMVGMAASVFLLARQSYLIDAVPAYMRARAMSTLGGTNRIGVFIGPFAGAGMIHFMGLAGAYWVALAAMAAAGAIAYSVPDLHAGKADGAMPAARPRIADVARSHARIFLTIGVAILLISALRASRQVVLPLWGDHLGLNPSLTSIVYGLVAAVDMSVFYPAGKVMDQHGRLWVAVPASILMGLSLMAIPYTGHVASFVVVSLILGFGNGISSGIVMTLGADASPDTGRTQFLGIWRLMSDLGTSAGPVVLSAITAAASLATGMAAIGAMGLAAAAMFQYWTPRLGLDRKRR